MITVDTLNDLTQKYKCCKWELLVILKTLCLKLCLRTIHYYKNVSWFYSNYSDLDIVDSIYCGVCFYFIGKVTLKCVMHLYHILLL